MKSWTVRIIYVSILLLGTFAVVKGHLNHRPNRIILGTGLMVLAAFLMHYPISFIKDKGF